jgi:5-methylcytosine-specific restriction endonuclease McrA
MKIKNFRFKSTIKQVQTDNRRKVEAHRKNSINRKLVEQYRKAHALCERCLAQRHYVPTEQIHHVKDILDGGTSQPDNLLALCVPCHELVTAEPPPLDTQRAWKRLEGDNGT